MRKYRMLDNETTSIIRKFEGLYNTGLSKPDPQGLARHFDFVRPRGDYDQPFSITSKSEKATSCPECREFRQPDHFSCLV